jgi:hypothetical protein
MMPLDLPSTEAELVAYRRSLRDRMREAAGPIPKAPPIDHEAVRLEAEKLIEGGFLRGVRPDFRNSIAEANRLRLRNED